MKYWRIGLLSFFFCHLSFSVATAQDIFPVTDPAMQRSLNGTWQLKVVKGIVESTDVPEQDASWRAVPVPGCWEQYGFCEPRYDKADSLTGYYRTSFAVPREWRDQRIVLRFDGVLYGYDLWVNGLLAGSWRSGYNTALFDITSLLNRKSDTQQLAIRVITQFPGSDFDYNDDWAPTGIFRDVTLMAVPKTHLSDLTIHTKNTGEVTVLTTIAHPAKDIALKHEILNARGEVISKVGGSGKEASQLSRLTIENPLLWSAETPHLYTLRTTLSKKGQTLQTFHHRFGIRELTIDGNVLKLNGQPVKLRGVTCHSTDPRTLKVVSDALTLRDMKLMKEASVNYIRTSHYPREPRFYELADSLGFYVISEVPFGYGDKNLSKEEFYPVLQQRAEATIRRDKNHPSVLIWSLGNENPLTDITIRLGDYVHASLDSVRPYCYPQVGSYFRRFWEKSSDNPFPSAAPIYAPHYPTTGQIAGFYQHLDRPVIFTEYCHTLGISFEDHDRQWEIIQRTPGIAGGSVWEWVDQGAPFMSEKKKETAEGRRFSGYEEKVYTSEDAGFQMFGNKGTDGLLYADRTPLPNYYELQHNYARAFVAAVDSVPQRLMVNGRCSMFNVRCTNRYDFLNLKDNVTIAWALTHDIDTIARGAFSPDCKPHESVDYPLSLPAQALASDSTLVVLHFALSDVQGHRFLQQSFVLQKPKVEWGGTGRVTDCLQTEPMVRAGRKATLAESVTQKGRLPRHYLLPLSNTEVTCTLDRQPFDGGEHVSFTLQPDSADVFRAELGLAYLLDASIDRVQWIGQGPFASYPGRHQACRYGLWAKQMGDLYFEGNHGGVDAALLTDAAGNGLLVTGDSLDLNFEQTDRGLVLTVNAGVSGQGPKFRRTAFPIEAKTPTARFTVYRVEAGRWPSVLRRLFRQPSAVPSPFRPFLTQYDTYLNRFDDIFGKTEKEK